MPETSSVFQDAAFVASFGPTGSGKSCDHVAAFPRAVVFSLTREIKSAITVLGVRPRIIPAATLYDVESVVDALITQRKKGDKGALFHNAVIVDDVTVIGYHTEQGLRDGLDVKGRGHLRPKNWDLWTELRNQLLGHAFRISEKCKQAGLHFAANGHQRVSRTNNTGKLIRGGIDLPTDLAESFAAGTDLCARFVNSPERLFHPAIFDVSNNDPSWATKNRFGLRDQIPANTGEILRHAGYTLPRGADMDHCESIVEQLAQYVQGTLGAQPYDKVGLQRVLGVAGPNLVRAVPNPVHLAWVVRDAVDRAHLRRLQLRNVYEEIGMVPVVAQAPQAVQ